MNKKLILLLAAALFIGGINLDLAAYAVSGPFGYDLQKDINRKKSQPKNGNQINLLIQQQIINLRTLILIQ